MEVILHDIGEGMMEADINCFLVKLGDYVKADDPLIEIQTDKMTAEILAPKAGIVKEFTVQQGQTVSVGTTLLILEDKSSEEDDKVHRNAHVQEEVFTPKHAMNKRTLASPFTRKIARESGVDIDLIIGSGPAGRITDEDVYQFISSKNKVSDKIATEEEEKNIVPIGKPEWSNTIPFRGRRKQIAKKMMQSVQVIPHCTHFEEIDVTELLQFRNELKKIKQNISSTAFFIKALSVCLKEFPIFNACLSEEKELIFLQHEHHFGIAVDTEDGLIVPVIKNIENKTIGKIYEEMKNLTQKAMENKLNLSDITGGTITISNVGPLGGSFGATPIIQYPQVALVSFHKTKKMPVVTEEDQIVIRSIMNISMSFDHRVADGATAVRFTNRFSQLIQNPKMLLLEMV